MDAPPTAAGTPGRELSQHLKDPLYRTAYFLIAGSGATAVLGFVFWTVAAHSYSARIVGLNSAVISAMTLLSGACQLGLSTVLVRYIPMAGARARGLVLRSYALTVALSLVAGAAVALASPLWSPRLSFLAHDAGWLIGFTLATACFTVFSLQDAVMTGLQAAQWVPLENTLYSAAKLILLVVLTGTVALAGPFIAWNVPTVIAVALVSALIFRRLLSGRRRAATGAVFDPRRLVRTAAGNYAATLFSLGVVYLLPVLVANETTATTTAYFFAPWLISTALLLVASNTATSMTVEAALDEAQLRQLFRRSVVHTLRLLIPLVAIVILAASPILSVFGHRYAVAGAPLLRVLALSAVPNAVIALGLAVARVQHRGGALIVIQAGEFVPLVALTVPLLDSNGLSGVGVAFLASQSAVAVGLLLTILRPYLPTRSRTPIA